MNIIDIIAKKRDGYQLNKSEINYFINNYVSGEVKDYQASALLMAIYLNGMSRQETVDLTRAMMYSGEVIDLSNIKGVKVDKHSTGGVGDKTSIVLGPIVASAGAKLAMISGRGLGHTGGTLDKLESIPGMNVSLTDKQFKKQVKQINIAVMSQTANINPADKKMYALRDVTATVGVIPLIASSIMSKKLASGSNTILLDVKIGSGAFMKNLTDAKKLTNTLVDIGNFFKRDTRAIITDMRQPLGYAVGNILEIKEAIDTLKGNGPDDFTELCLQASAIILNQAKLAKSFKDGYSFAKKQLTSGAAFKKFKTWIKAQGGNTTYLDNPQKFKKAKHIILLKSNIDGYIEKIDALQIGEASMHLGAGRLTKDDSIDYAAGIILKTKVGFKIKKGGPLCEIHTNKNNYQPILKDVKKAFVITKKPVKVPSVVLEYIK
ncbi:MAG: thymidine phosphorylase [Bacilli bacterium]|nr:thymidine phosphorylase [Bacilli bacterium]